MKFKDYFTPKSMVYTGEHIDIKTTIKHYQYNAQELIITDDFNKKESFKHYIQVIGLTEVDKIMALKEIYPVEPLILEDVFNVSQRVKIDDRKEYIFAVFHVNYFKETVKEDYMSLLFFKDTIITFHEKDPDCLEALYPLFENYPELRERGVDFLFYQILDIITDRHIDLMEHNQMVTEQIEEEILEYKSVDQEEFYQMRKSLLKLKSNVSPILNQIDKIIQSPKGYISAEQFPYFDDLKDHLSRLDERLSDARELMRHLLDLHINNQSNKMNEIMKTLTLFSAIFIPLSFLTGFFGMNFVHFDVLTYENAVLVFVLGCFILAAGMVYLFKRMNWFK
jgi:magnesium transporter